MKIGINQFCWPTSMPVHDALATSKRLGYQCFEACFTAADGVSGGGVTDALDISGYHNPFLNTQSTPQEVKELGRMAADCGLEISSVGGIVTFSIYPLTAVEESAAQKSLDAAKKMLDFAQILGAGTVMLIPGMLTADMEYRAAYCRVQERLAGLADYAPGVTIAMENVWNGLFYSPLELARFIDEAGRDNLGVYFDVANARRFGYPQQWVRTLGRRIKALHLKDYRVANDNINSFTNLLDGDVDYPQVVQALREVGFDGVASVELIPPARYYVEATLAYARQTAEQLFQL